MVHVQVKEEFSTILQAGYAAHTGNRYTHSLRLLEGEKQVAAQDHLNKSQCAEKLKKVIADLKDQSSIVELDQRMQAFNESGAESLLVLSGHLNYETTDENRSPEHYQAKHASLIVSASPTAELIEVKLTLNQQSDCDVTGLKELMAQKVRDRLLELNSTHQQAIGAEISEQEFDTAAN